MTAWELLLEKSSITVGTAWEHLMSALQLGAGLVINDGVYVEIQNMEIEARIDDTDLILIISESEISIELDDDEITAEICE